MNLTKAKQIYLDKASTKPIEYRWNKLLFQENKNNYYNLSSLFPQCFKNKRELEKIRNYFRRWLDAQSYSIVFTSGASESINLALKGVSFAKYLEKKKNCSKNKLNIIISSIEHKVTLEICKFLKGFDFEIRFIPVLDKGIIDIDILKKILDKDTILLSLSYINNETGTIQPIDCVCDLKKKYKFIFHCDITASINYGPLSLKRHCIDLASFSANKMCGIKGLGGVAIKDFKIIPPLIHGGGHQNGIRSGTENFPAIKVWGEYLKEKFINYEKDQEKIKLLDNYCIKAFKKEFGDRVIFNSFIEGERIPGIINVSIKNIPHNELVAFLSQRNIFVGTGSACNNIHFEESKVMNAMGLSREEQENVLRISFDENNRFSDFNVLVEKIKFFERNLKKDKGLKVERTKDLNDMLPDCESYRNIVFKYWFNRIRRMKK